MNLSFDEEEVPITQKILQTMASKKNKMVKKILRIDRANTVHYTDVYSISIQKVIVNMLTTNLGNIILHNASKGIL